MAGLSKKPEPKKYAKSSEDPFGNEESITSTVSEMGNLGTSERSNDSFKQDPVTDATQKTNTRVISLQSPSDKVHEFDVDVLHSWDQSSGTISYEAHSNLDGTFNNAKMLPDYKDIICRARLNQRLLCDSMPSQKILSVKSLTAINETMRREHAQGHLFKRIVVPCKQNESTERYELISKMCDDAINEYMTISNHRNKILEINLECGGSMPPRFTVKGIRAEKSIKYDDDYCDISQTGQVCKAKHSLQHLSTCSPPIPYPSANTFSRCSIENYVKLLKKRRKM